MKINSSCLLVKALLAATVLQITLMPIAVLAQQSETNQSEILKERRSLAETQTAEANARKAEADAAMVRSDIAKQDIETRKAQIDALKGTSTIEGSLVENNIAASKALGCAAGNIAFDFFNLELNPDFLLLFDENTANGLSEYTSLIAHTNYVINEYSGSTVEPKSKGAIEAVLDRLKEYQRLHPGVTEQQIADLNVEIAKLKSEIDELSKLKTNQLNPAANIKVKKFPSKVMLADQEQVTILKESSTQVMDTVAGLATLATPTGAIIRSVLAGLAMFKADVDLKGTKIDANDRDLANYLFRTLKLTADPNGKVARRANGPKMIAPDDIVLSRVDQTNSTLFKQLRELNRRYYDGRKTSEFVALKRLEVLNRAEIENKKAALKDMVKLMGLRLDKAVEELAVDMQSPLALARFNKSKLELSLANANLDLAQKKIDKIVAEFDDFLSDDLNRLESLNRSTDTFAKQLAGGAEKDSASQRTLTSLLRSEAISTIINTRIENREPVVMWLDASVSSNGANQMRKSSPIIDVFTRGPMISYSGGTVVTYQIRDMAGEIRLAGTVWAYAPYRKSKNIMKFECQGIRNNGAKYSWSNP